MSVYLDGSSVLLNAGSVATDAACCCTTTGACCHIDGSCDIETEDACITGGGAYRGDGTDCDPNPCVLCSDTITLCKCGYPEFTGFESTPPKYYLQREFHVTRTDVTTAPFPECSCNWDFTTTNVGTVDGDGNCSVVCTCSGATDCADIIDCSWVTGGAGTCGDNNWAAGCHGTESGCPAGCTGYCLVADSGGPVSATESIETCSNHVFSGLDVDFIDHITLSSEYTTAMLIANTLALLPMCPDGCTAIYALNEDQSCCTAWCVYTV